MQASALRRLFDDTQRSRLPRPRVPQLHGTGGPESTFRSARQTIHEVQIPRPDAAMHEMGSAGRRREVPRERGRYACNQLGSRSGPRLVRAEQLLDDGIQFRIIASRPVAGFGERPQRQDDPAGSLKLKCLLQRGPAHGAQGRQD